ncbi:UDP-glucose 4-epimerase GalE [Azospirillum formosense]|uniref:UDP-glucose 4-epimerase n=1 Tax=Azospirillum formosense TaxID=861533 RepID=A0ABX2KV49_9PROT|nr:UDP-glucose 4-epimerase GalE [Azospirillum formosense]MBY3757577.1 UDP-glucose 4-epimerase GalE [Azospirillum formosense]NUB19503.1 UDP-glucose 4-epimerase GalE [Azospirillum formosense]
MTSEPVPSSRVLVTGGAGYIGSHVLHALADAGIPAVTIDNLSTGRRQAVPASVPLVEGDVGSPALLDEVIREHGVDAVMHFAGSIVVPESVEKPLAYYRNNTVSSLTLLDACVRHGIDKLVFSSTAAVYGAPERVPIDEDAPTAPINPYGASKLMTEQMLRDAGAAHGLRSVILRYFNVAGADPAGRTGQATPVATHLIKVACQALLGQRPALSVFGTDYPTPDGTCIRDYIHVSDLADAHVLALLHLRRGGDSLILNCGYGRGASVREVVRTLESVSGETVPATLGPRRAGDPPQLVSAAARIRERLGWVPKHDSLEEIVRSALSWERRLDQERAGRDGA